MWIIAIIVIFIIYKVITGNNNAKYRTQYRSPSEPSSNSYGYSYGSESARSVCRAYENALRSQNKAELMRAVDDMIGGHWASSYSNDYDTSMLFEKVAQSHPFYFPTDYRREDYRGLALHEVFRNQNVEIKAQKEGKAPYTTPLPYKPRV